MTREDLQLFFYEQYNEQGPYRIGPRTSHSLRTDPRHLLFTLSRYKFCAKMLEGYDKVLEIGCGDAFGAPLVLQSVKKLYAVDIDAQAIENDMEYNEFPDRLHFACQDWTKPQNSEKFDAIYSLDVIEHLEPDTEKTFLQNIHQALKAAGVCIIGTPNINANQHASEISRKGHINLKSASDLRASLSSWFHNIFIFSMNDEVIHTGYYPMAHYFMALCAYPRMLNK